MTRPLVGGEKESLWAALDRHRDVVLWKLADLDDEQLRRVVVPSGTSLLGLVKHLAAVEYGWFGRTFGRRTEAMPFDEDDPEADLRVEPSDTTADLLAFYRRARAAADHVICDLDMDTRARLVGRPGVDALGTDPHDRGDGAARRVKSTRTPATASLSLVVTGVVPGLARRRDGAGARGHHRRCGASAFCRRDNCPGMCVPTRKARPRATWDADLAPSMADAGVAVYEEQVLDHLLDDLASCAGKKSAER